MRPRAPLPADRSSPLPSISQLKVHLLAGGLGLLAALPTEAVAQQAENIEGGLRPTTPGALHQPAHATTSDASAPAPSQLATEGDGGASGDASTGDAEVGPTPPPEPPPLGGVPMRTGGDVPRRGACACDVPRASNEPGVTVLVAGALAAVLARRRRARKHPHG